MNRLASPHKSGLLSLADEKFMFGREMTNRERFTKCAWNFVGPSDLSDEAWRPALTRLAADIRAEIRRAK